MNLYEILGVKRDADNPAIRAAYVKMAKTIHPDRGGNAADFKEVARAYGVLGRPDKRLAYDETGREEAGPSPLDAAIAILRNLTEMVIANNLDPARTDFLKEMQGQIAQALAHADQQTADIKRKVARCKSLAKRFKAKASDDLIGKILQGRIDEMQRQIAAIDGDRINLETAKVLLADYQYEVDPSPTGQASMRHLPDYLGFAAQNTRWMNQ